MGTETKGGPSEILGKMSSEFIEGLKARIASLDRFQPTVMLNYRQRLAQGQNVNEDILVEDVVKLFDEYFYLGESIDSKLDPRGKMLREQVLYVQNKPLVVALVSQYFPEAKMAGSQPGNKIKELADSIMNA